VELAGISAHIVELVPRFVELALRFVELALKVLPLAGKHHHQRPPIFERWKGGRGNSQDQISSSGNCGVVSEDP
jgi:hypothetical protein